MTNYLSTRNNKNLISASQAIINGLAPDGGLYVPDSLSDICLDYHEVISKDYFGMAETVFRKFFPDFDEETIHRIVERSYTGKFSTEEITPLSKVSDAYILELYHGPTCAFKDVALSALPNLMTEALRINDFDDEILILTATSGDTGSAALHGFSDVPGTKIIVFYPEGGVSETQKLQMVTQSGKNTCAVAVRGNFDDAQTGVKRLFQEIPKPCDGVSLSSANSINIGRLVPQVVYYFSAYQQLLKNEEIQDGDKVNFVVPTGNFGDIMAGYFARQMGLPVGRLVCASNENDVLKEFLDTGRYNRKREFHKTSSPSMDILVSSNLERLLYFVCGTERTRIYMDLLAKQGEYTVTSEELAKIQEIFSGVACDDKRGAKAIGDIFKSNHYVMDTHTAIAWAAYEECRDAGEAWTENPTVVLSTASPYKFTRAVLTALGEEESASDAENMAKLEHVTGADVPEPLKGIFDREICHRDVINISEMQEYVVDHAKM